MTADQAREAGVPETERDLYFCVGHGKTNMARRGNRVGWRKFASVRLGNGGTGLLAGMRSDEVGVVTPWEWPTIKSITEAVLDDALTAIKKRIGAGDYRASEQAAAWAGNIVAEVLGIDLDDKANKRRIKAMLKQWKRTVTFAPKTGLTRSGCHGNVSSPSSTRRCEKFATPQKSAVRQGVASVAKTNPDTLPHHHHHPVGGVVWQRVVENLNRRRKVWQCGATIAQNT